MIWTHCSRGQSNRYLPHRHPIKQNCPQETLHCRNLYHSLVSNVKFVNGFTTSHFWAAALEGPMTYDSIQGSIRFSIYLVPPYPHLPHRLSKANSSLSGLKSGFLDPINLILIELGRCTMDYGEPLIITRFSDLTRAKTIVTT